MPDMSETPQNQPQYPQYQPSTVDVKLDYLQRDVNDIKRRLEDNVSRREFTEGMKIVREAIPNEDDHENRLRSLEQFKWQLVGGLIVMQFLSDYILYVVLKK